MSAQTVQGITTTGPALTALDRCAGCGAQAYIRVNTELLGEFLFCGHHWRESEPNLALATPFISVHDELHKLEPQPFDPETDNC